MRRGMTLTGRLEFQKKPLCVLAAGVAAEGSVAAQDPMTGDHDGNGIGRAGAAHGTDRARAAAGPGDLGVAGGRAEADPGEASEDPVPEAAAEPQVERQVERAALPREVLIELARGAVEPGGRAQDARADLAREPLEHRVVPLGPERDPHEALRRSGEQKSADRRVEGAVRDVEEARLAG